MTMVKKAKWALAVQMAGAIVSAICAGCVIPGYLGDRARDAGDIFTISVGKGVGARVRAGPIQRARYGVRSSQLTNEIEDMRCADYETTKCQM